MPLAARAMAQLSSERCKVGFFRMVIQVPIVEIVAVTGDCSGEGTTNAASHLLYCNGKRLVLFPPAHECQEALPAYLHRITPKGGGMAILDDGVNVFFGAECSAQ
jgi:hypothetical protein